MSDSWVVNVRQVTEYPLKPVADPGDAVLIQTGGLGGPYNFTTPVGIAQALEFPGGQLGVGVGLPGDAVNTGVVASLLVTPPGCTQGWNFYINSLGAAAYLRPGAAGRWCFDSNGTLAWGTAAGGNGPIPFSTVMSLGRGGYLSVADTMLVGRNPTAAMEVATLDFVMRLRGDSVTSFNGRAGDVTLDLCDILAAGGAPLLSPHLAGDPRSVSPSPGDDTDRIATTQWVQHALCTSTVRSFNGRAGNIRLDLQDVMEAGGAPLCSPEFVGVPSAPTPPWFVNSDQLATTAFVHAAIGQQFSRQISVSDKEPGHPQPGWLWWDSSQTPHGGQLYVWYVDGGCGSWVVANSLEGAVGPQGPPGSSIKGSYDTLADLQAAHPVGQTGDAYLVAGDMYVWDADTLSWLDVGSLVGPTGPMGPAGPPTYLLGSTPPTAGFGEAWLNTTDNSLQFFDGTNWLPISYLRLDGGTITGDVTFEQDVTIDHALNVGGAAAFEDNVTLDKDLTVAGDVNIDGDIGVQGDAGFYAGVGVHGNLTAYADARVDGTLSCEDLDVTGTVTLSADPTIALQAATKQYVDTRAVPAGGAINAVLRKTSAADYATAWTVILPAGGAAGTVPRKNSATDWDITWSSNGTVPAGGTANQALTKTSATDFALTWQTLVPTGGAANSFLRKNSTTNFDASWSTTGTIPTGGTQWQVIQKSSSNDYDYTWALPGVRSGSRNTAIGRLAANANTSTGLTAFGDQAATSNTTGNYNCAFGDNALQINTVSQYSCAFGSEALAVFNPATAANYNTAMGFYALRYLTTGANNTAIGGSAGRTNPGGGNVTNASNSTFIGYESRPQDGLTTQTNQTALGYMAVGQGSNTVTLGNGSILTTNGLFCRSTVIVAPSDVRLKQDVELADGDICIAAVKSLPVKRFHWNEEFTNCNDKHVTGFVADDVEKVFPKSVTVSDQYFPRRSRRDESDQDDAAVIRNCKVMGMDQGLPTLWAAVQRLIARCEELERKLDTKG